MATGLIACLEAAEAVKVITGSPDLRRGIFFADLWANSFDIIDLKRDPNCPVCGAHRYDLLGRASGTYTTALCGQDAYQVVPGSAGTGKPAALDLSVLAARLEQAGTVTATPFMLSFKNDRASFQLFPDGRAIVRGVTSGAAARAVYSEYVGV
jgi:adenylyltransferase/sulfurtransferase